MLERKITQKLCSQHTSYVSRCLWMMQGAWNHSSQASFLFTFVTLPMQVIKIAFAVP